MHISQDELAAQLTMACIACLIQMKPKISEVYWETGVKDYLSRYYLKILRSHILSWLPLLNMPLLVMMQKYTFLPLRRVHNVGCDNMCFHTQCSCHTSRVGNNMRIMSLSCWCLSMCHTSYAAHVILTCKFIQLRVVTSWAMFSPEDRLEIWLILAGSQQHQGILSRTWRRWMEHECILPFVD
jgi:hypothetical protein